MSRQSPLPSLFVRIVIAAVLVTVAARTAYAQNLVQNPDFFNDLAGYTVTGDAFAASFAGGPTNSADPEGTNVGEGDGPGSGNGSVDAVIMQVLTTAPGTTYMVTFSYAVEPGVADSMTASFGTTSKTLTSSKCDGSTCLDTISFLATSGSGRTTTLKFDGSEGAYIISDLDVEAGPAPATGGGIVSFGVVMAGLGFRRMRRLGSAREVGA